MAERRGWSIRARLTALLVATLVPLAGLAIYWLARESRDKHADVEREAREAASRVAAQAADVVGDVQGMLAVLARLPAVRARDRGEAERLFRELLATSPHLENVAAFTRDGTLFAAAAPITPGARISVQDRAWFQAVVQSGQPVASGFLVSRITGRPVAVLARPVLDGQGRLLGVVGAALQLAAVSQKVAPVRIGGPALWAIVDGQGLALLHATRGAAIGKPFSSPPGTLRAEAVVPGTPWRAVVGIPEAVVTVRVREELLEIGLPAVLILLAASGLGLWIARNTWRPLQALAMAVRRIGSGEPGIRIPAETGGEVGEVATAFQEALDALDRRHAELTALLKANRAVGSSLDLDEILQIIVHEATAISGIAVVRLFLLDEDAQVLRCRVGVGLPLEATQDFAVPVGESFSGQVAATSQPLAVADCREDTRFPYAQQLKEHGLISYLGLPVKLGDRVFGVLVFNTKAPRTYSEAEIAYLSAFADQAAIVIENARLFQQEQDRRRQVEAVRAVTGEITQELDLTTLLGLIIRRAAELVGVVSGEVYLWDEAAQALAPAAWYGVGDWMREVRVRLGEGVSGTVAQRRQGMIVNDYRTSPYAHPIFLERTGAAAVLAVPLLYQDRLLGVITLNDEETGRPFTGQESETLALFAAQAAIAIENARLHETVRHHAADLEVRVRERTAELEEALRVKSQFLANMSHELRTPLNAVLGFSEVLLDRGPGDLTSKQERYLQQIHDGGKRLLELVTNILDFSQAEAGKGSLHLEPVPLAPLVQEVLDLVAVQAAQKRIDVTTALDPSLPVVVADRHRLGQILHHLVSNAVKFTPHGGRVALTARRVDWSSGQMVDSSKPIDDSTARPIDIPGAPTARRVDWSTGQEVDLSRPIDELTARPIDTPSPLPPSPPAPLQFVEIAVQDSGIGILPENLERIFRGFEQVESSHARRYEGAGLGLALVRRLVELHGGRVWAESHGENRGARFIVRLPLLAAPPVQRILVVEDEAPVLNALCTGLAAAGYGVDAARTGAEALERMAATPPELLVLDIGLPDVHGCEVLKRVRGEECTRDLPVLVLTGQENIHADQALALGADEFLAKPVSARVLAETVARLLARPAATRATETGMTIED